MSCNNSVYVTNYAFDVVSVRLKAEELQRKQAEERERQEQAARQAEIERQRQEEERRKKDEDDKRQKERRLKELQDQLDREVTYNESRLFINAFDSSKNGFCSSVWSEWWRQCLCVCFGV